MHEQSVVHMRVHFKFVETNEVYMSHVKRQTAPVAWAAKSTAVTKEQRIASLRSDLGFFKLRASKVPQG